ncbi:MAG: hypothetical protein V7K30_02210 [Nostoc sp.]
MLPCSQPEGWECIPRGLLPLAKKEEAAALPGWVPSLQARNQSGQGLYLNLVPFRYRLLWITGFTVWQ